MCISFSVLSLPDLNLTKSGVMRLGYDSLITIKDKF